MTLEQCKRRYQKATLTSSKAWVRYDKFLGRLRFELSTGEIVYAVTFFRYLDWNGGLYYPVSSVLERVGDPNARLLVKYRSGLMAGRDSELWAKATELYDAATKAEDTAESYKLALHDDFKLSYTEINDLYRGI